VAKIQIEDDGSYFQVKQVHMLQCFPHSDHSWSCDDDTLTNMSTGMSLLHWGWISKRSCCSSHLSFTWTCSEDRIGKSNMAALWDLFCQVLSQIHLSSRCYFLRQTFSFSLLTYSKLLLQLVLCVSRMVESRSWRKLRSLWMTAWPAVAASPQLRVSLSHSRVMKRFTVCYATTR
jgi:hypothetical protein